MQLPFAHLQIWLNGKHLLPTTVFSFLFLFFGSDYSLFCVALFRYKFCSRITWRMGYAIHQT